MGEMRQLFKISVSWNYFKGKIAVKRWECTPEFLWLQGWRYAM
jgi:hypothetical protein